MNDIVIEVKNATVRFNKSTESISGLKEYIIKVEAATADVPRPTPTPSTREN